MASRGREGREPGGRGTGKWQVSLGAKDKGKGMSMQGGSPMALPDTQSQLDTGDCARAVRGQALGGTLLYGGARLLVRASPVRISCCSHRSFWMGLNAFCDSIS